MKKYDEMTTIEKIVYVNTIEAYNSYTGGLENTMLDYAPDTKEYKQAEKDLADPMGIEGVVFADVIHTLENQGIKERRFATNQFIIDIIHRQMRKDGYLPCLEKS